ncbi:MAG TPA: hypothetical protein VE961_13360 [Pyrinomonadaceae bacterium]|nr:hypothetical protein [Pyrinomonadaceae bacterium]
MTWARRSSENLLPLSEEKESLKNALREWIYSGETYDLQEPRETCELCDHPDLRYQFKIINKLNLNELLVGSECINKFGILAVDDDGIVLDQAQSRRRIQQDRRYLIAEAKRNRLITTLVELANRDIEFKIASFIDYVQDRGAFTPSQLGLLFWRLDLHGVDYVATDFKVTIRRNREKEQLIAMADWKLKKIWSAMSSNQKDWYKDNKG